MSKVEIIKQKGHNFLWIDDYLWMWDISVEQKAQKKIANKAFGKVLVAGYGLGLVQKYLEENPLVESVVTIESLSEVVKKANETYGEIYGKIIIADFFNYTTANKYDCVVGDVWEDIEEESLEKYNKFKKVAKKFLKTDGKILAWGQEFFEALNSQKYID